MGKSFSRCCASRDGHEYQELKAELNQLREENHELHCTNDGLLRTNDGLLRRNRKLQRLLEDHDSYALDVIEKHYQILEKHRQGVLYEQQSGNALQGATRPKNEEILVTPRLDGLQTPTCTPRLPGVECYKLTPRLPAVECYKLSPQHDAGTGGQAAFDWSAALHEAPSPSRTRQREMTGSP
eukprot:TRINITY_DN66119_c0_g1_i1.p1 TRINITY_DN66119_c0_g1~~TRINITY_DN66119_c0_g1_i1.p1  ORF type:complete len:182 (+),score=37.75 TRINITY_DN66119_c0_g1_i1:90-635(+)